MPWKKNIGSNDEYYYKPIKTKERIIQQDRLKEHGYKTGQFSPKFFENIEKELSLTERGYWAYAIDGDGCVGKNHNGLRVKIALSDPEPIQHLSNIYKTSISVAEYLEDERHKPSYITRLYGKRAIHFLRLICPYMTEKRKKATQLINIFDPNYHPAKIPMNFLKYPGLILAHMGMVGGFFDTEGSVGIKVRIQKLKTKIYHCLTGWINFSNSDPRPIRKIKKILETPPFSFKSTFHRFSERPRKRKNGKKCKVMYRLDILASHHLLFMKMFSPWILITRKRDYADKFERKKQIYEMCKK